MKRIFFLAVFALFCRTHAQQFDVKIIGADNTAPLKDAKVITDKGVFYTNEEGLVLAEGGDGKFTISAPTYFEQQISKSEIGKVITLQPKFTDIQEVILESSDIREILQNTLKNYQNIYLSKPSLYAGVIKQKAYIGGKISNLLIADINVWSKYNLFNFSEAKNIDGFFQMNLDNIRYFKTTKTSPDYPFNNDVQIVPSSFVSKVFLNAEIAEILHQFKDNKFVSKVANTTAGIQKITFTVEDNQDMDFSGYIIFNKNDNAITFMEVQGKNRISKKRPAKNKLGEDYSISNDTFLISYDFTKKDHKYLPTKVKISVTGSGTYKGKEIPANMIQEINLQKFQSSNDKGLKEKIDLTKNITDNVPLKSSSESKTLLTSEEQNFVNEH